jgi:hypothetical protein
VRVTADPLGLFTLTHLDRSGSFTDHYAISLNADPVLRARYFSAPYPLRITALTTAGAHTFEAAGPVPSAGGADEAAERIVNAIACRLPATPVLPRAGEYHVSWLHDVADNLRATVTNNRGKATRPFAGFYGGLLSADVAPTRGRNGRFTYTDATFTLRGFLYTKLNDGTEVDSPVTARFVADGTGVTNPDGEQVLTVRPRQSLDFDVPRARLPAGYASITVPLTLAPAQVRFVAPALPR